MAENFVNTKMDDETISKLDAMVKADDSDRSKFIRMLIRKEYLTRAAAHNSIEVTVSPDHKIHGDQIGAGLARIEREKAG